MHVLTPEEIAEHIHEEFTAYSQMSLEDQKKRLAEMIHEYTDSKVNELVEKWKGRGYNLYD